MKERRPWTYFTCKTWTSDISRKFPRYLETTQARQFSSLHYTVVSFPAARKSHFSRHHAKFATNACFERCVGPLRHTHENQSFICLDMQLWTPLTSLVVADFLSCGRPIVGTNFPVNISEKFIAGGTNFRGVQIKCDKPIRLLKDQNKFAC